MAFSPAYTLPVRCLSWPVFTDPVRRICALLVAQMIYDLFISVKYAISRATLFSWPGPTPFFEDALRV